MDHISKPTPVNLGRFAAGMALSGMAFTVGILSVLYRRFPVEELTGTVRFVGLVLFVGSWLLLRRATPGNLPPNGQTTLVGDEKS